MMMMVLLAITITIFQLKGLECFVTLKLNTQQNTAVIEQTEKKDTEEQGRRAR